MADLLLKMPPFSQERSALMNKGYDLVINIMSWCDKDNTAPEGTVNKSVELVCRFLSKYSRDILLYEAGTGSGIGCRNFLKYDHVSVKGCDVFLQDSVKELMQEYPDRISVSEDTFYHHLQSLDDESIDVFYADNVFEHLFPDEFPETMQLLTRKLKHGALLLLFIPNSIDGPYDISGRFLKMGSKAQGFHFMEQTCREITETYKQYDIYPAYFVCKTIFKNYVCFEDKSGKLNKLKLLLEDMTRLVPGRWLRRKVAGLFCLSTYIMRKA